jgi:hypothetical protein
MTSCRLALLGFLALSPAVVQLAAAQNAPPQA